MMEGLCKARLKKQGIENFVLVCGRAVISR